MSSLCAASSSSWQSSSSCDSRPVENWSSRCVAVKANSSSPTFAAVSFALQDAGMQKPHWVAPVGERHPVRWGRAVLGSTGLFAPKTQSGSSGHTQVLLGGVPRRRLGRRPATEGRSDKELKRSAIVRLNQASGRPVVQGRPPASLLDQLQRTIAIFHAKRKEPLAHVRLAYRLHRGRRLEQPRCRLVSARGGGSWRAVNRRISERPLRRLQLRAHLRVGSQGAHQLRLLFVIGGMVRCSQVRLVEKVGVSQDGVGRWNAQLPVQPPHEGGVVARGVFEPHL
eukprot:scaffold10220_cov144-Isochrysis_galbana.AAC.14